MSIEQDISERLNRLQAIADSMPGESASRMVRVKTPGPQLARIPYREPDIVCFQIRPGDWRQGKEEGEQIISLETGKAVPPRLCRITQPKTKPKNAKRSIAKVDYRRHKPSA